MRLARTVMVATSVVTLALGAAAATASTATSSPSTSPVATAAQFNGRVAALLVVDGTVYVGGSFSSALDADGTWVPRAGLAAVDGTTGALDSTWRASANGAVSALATDGTQLFVGGSFSTLSGANRPRLGSVSLTTGGTTGWAPPVPDKAVLALAVSGTRLYSGGLFQFVSGSPRGRLAAFDTTTAALDPDWVPRAATGKVNAIAVSIAGDQLYVGGTFSAMNGNSVFGYQAGVDPITGANTGWPSDHAYYQIFDFAVSDDGVFAGGGGSGGHLLAWRPDGSFLSDPYQTDGGVQSVVTQPGLVLAGGHFTNVCLGNTGGGSPFVCSNPLPRRKLFAVDLASSAYTPWNPAANSAQGVLAMVVVPSSGGVAVGGDFTKINGQSRQHFALFPPSS